MKTKVFWWNWGSTVMAALVLAFSGAAMAGPIGGQSPDRVVYAGKSTVQAGDQDPNTPPDCKKFPNDSRCGIKK